MSDETQHPDAVQHGEVAERDGSLDLSTLMAKMGSERAARLALAYDRAIAILSLNDRLFAPSNRARLEIIRAMLRVAEETDYNVDRLTLAGLSARDRSLQCHD